MLTLNDGRSELWQWDTGRTLAVDADCSQVHFSNKVFGRSIDVDVVDCTAIIPDVLLQTDNDLNVWAFVGTAENGYTKISKTFKVNRRNKPADYVFTPVEQTTLAELSGRLDRIEESQDPDAIKNAVDDYLKKNPVEAPVKSVNGQIGAVELTAKDVGAISLDDLQAATNEALAQAKASGEFDGADGKSAYQYAVEGGYTGTETEFTAKLAQEIPSVDSTLTQSGQAADAAVVGNRISALSEDIGSQSSNSAQTYKTEDIGELFTAPANYTAWCPGNLRWDGNLQKFVSLIYAAPAHVHSTSDLYVSYIDQESFSATQPEKCRYVDTDGETDITPDNAGTCSFLILSDGTYLMIHLAADGNTYKFTSADNGVTWQKVSAVTGYSGSPWNMTELSNGRIIMSDDESKVGFYYSDDDGVTFTQVIPGTCGGGYEAEACILELQPGKLIAIARYSTSGKGYYESGDSEAAIFASSDDYGTTWSNWKISTIDNMNASSCTGVVHDGIVEIFTASRWYSNGGNVNTDNANTGKNGAMMHYMATVANALVDNFTKVGIIDYARGAAGEYHSPCAAIDGNKRLLIVHMDGGEAATCNNRYLRGGIGNISYACTDNSASTVKAFSAAMVTKLLAEKQDSINYLQVALSKIEGSGVTPPTGIGTLVAKYVAAEMASSLIYPWSSGSDFNGNSAALYSVNTGATSTVHEFLVDDSGAAYLKTYGCIVRPIKSENAVDCYIKVEWNSRSITRTHCILNGYITVADIQNDTLVSISASGYIVIKEYVPVATTLEVHDGYCILGGTKYELPRVTVDDFLANYTEYTYFADHGRITELDPTQNKEMSNTVDQCGVFLQAYHNIYDIKYYETY